MSSGSGNTAAACAAKDEEEEVLMYGFKCPLGSQCKKGENSVIKGCTVYEDAVWAVENHLMRSPYHELAEQETKDLVQTLQPEMWMEKPKKVEPKVEKQKKEHRHPGTGAEGSGSRRRDDSRSPRRTHTSTRSAGRGRKDRNEPMQQLARRADRTLAPRTPQSAPDRVITFSEVEFKSCVDSLRRAKFASEAAANLCYKAARVFEEENRCIEQCQGVLESFL